MRATPAAFAALALVAAAFSIGAAGTTKHGGGLNACGCHVDHRTGACHCHRDRGCGCSCEPDRCHGSASETPRPPPPDRDADGIPDRDDACPDTTGVATRAGCPEPDADADGVPDSLDLCPEENEDHREPLTNDGCPGEVYCFGSPAVCRAGRTQCESTRAAYASMTGREQTPCAVSATSGAPADPFADWWRSQHGVDAGPSPR